MLVKLQFVYVYSLSEMAMKDILMTILKTIQDLPLAHRDTKVSSSKV